MTAQPSSQAEREDVAREVLAACPFCGGSNIAYVAGDGCEYTTCDDCLANGPVAATEAEAQAAWNRRPDREHATPRYTYDVTWSRSDGERLTCRDLTPKLVTARIIQAVKTSGSITIHAVEGHAATPRSMPEEVVEALQAIVQRADAYPADIFGEPDLDAVNVVLAAAGLSNQMDRMHASWARKCLTDVGNEARAALALIPGASA